MNPPLEPTVSPTVADVPQPARTAWSEKVGAFAATIGLPPEAVSAEFKRETGDESDASAALLSDPDVMSAVVITNLMSNLTPVPGAKLRAAIKALHARPVMIVVPTSDNGAATVRGVSLLPTVGDDESILALLRVGGVAKMSDADAIAAIRGAYTRAVGVTKILPKLLGKMLAHSVSLDEPVGPVYLKLRKASKRRQYTDVLEAFDGAITSVPEEEKQSFLDKVDSLWPALAAFQQQLEAYRQLYKDESGDVASILVAIRTGMAGVEMPNPSQVVASARGTIDRFNRVFGGLGIPTARTIAKDLTEEAKLLRDPELPGSVGAGSFEEMIKKLEIAVPSDVRQTEIDIANFVLGMLKLPEQPTNRQPEYILELQRLGKPIPFGTLGTEHSSKSNGGRSGRLDRQTF